MTKTTISWFLSLLCVLLLALPAQAAGRVEVAAGQQTILTLRGGITRMAVADPEVADVVVLAEGELRVLGVKPGRTQLDVWSGGKRHSFLIEVAPDMGGLREALARDPDTAGVRVDSDSAGAVRLSGRLDSLAAHDKALRLARAHVTDKLIDRTTVDGEQTVAVDVKFAALSVTSLKALGFDFRMFGSTFFAITSPGSVSSFSFSKDSTGASSFEYESGLPVADAFNLFVGDHSSGTMGILGVLSGADLAQVLAEPTLVVRSGENASFLAGGELPIPVPQGTNGIGIEYKTFGVKLDVAATVVSPSRILLRLTPEVSEPDFGNAVSIDGVSVPGFKKRTTSTTVELGDGESLVLSGLLYSTSGHNDDRIPGLADIPILGTFFKRTRAERERQELVVIATPRLVSAMPRNWRPELPGERVGKEYQPDLGDMLLDRNTLSDALVRYGLSR